MGRMVSGILVLVLGLSVTVGEEGRDKPATPAEQYEALASILTQSRPRATQVP